MFLRLIRISWLLHRSEYIDTLVHSKVAQGTDGLYNVEPVKSAPASGISRRWVKEGSNAAGSELAVGN